MLKRNSNTSLLRILFLDHMWSQVIKESHIPNNFLVGFDLRSVSEKYREQYDSDERADIENSPKAHN